MSGITRTEINYPASYEDYVPPGVISIMLEGLMNYIYPVGCYFETTDTTFNPNNEFIGTWVLETEGLVHVSSGSNYAVTENAQDGGEATHTLTSDESGLPAHDVTGGGITNGITGGSHTHQIGVNASGSNAFPAWALFFNTNTYAQGTTAQNKAAGNSGASTHTHNLPNHTHSVSASNASSAHNNMQPYKIVNRWHRIA